MKNKFLSLTISVFFILFSRAAASPDEGMWMFNQIDKLPWDEMKKHGLQIGPKQIYNADGVSLKDAVVLLGGGTSSFISADGLILTNHHVAFGAIQSVSSVEEDRLKEGFYAKTREEEISIPSYTAQIIVTEKEVTYDVLSAVNDTMTDDMRSKSIREKINELQEKEKEKSGYECRISEFYNGLKYFMYTYETFRDVRLVYAPPTAIGNFGGEVDNWCWPRHTGDFSLMRIYVSPDGKRDKFSKDNVPYKPKVYLPISVEGYDEGDFAMIIGFPGRTFRYRTSAEIELAKDETLPVNIGMFKKQMDIIEKGGKTDRATEIKYAGRWRRLANVYKNYQGTLEGMKRSDIVRLRKEKERKFQELICSEMGLEKKYGTLLSEMSVLQDEIKTYNKKQLVLSQLMRSSDLLQIAGRFRTFANSFKKDSTGDLKPPLQSYNSMKEHIPNVFKNMNLTLDKELLTSMILEGTNLPREQQIGCLADIAGKKTGEKRERAVVKFINNLYENSNLSSPEGCLKMLEKSDKKILRDEFVRFADELDKENNNINPRLSAYNLKIGILRSKLLEAYMLLENRDIYPDANRTIRFTYGSIKSYDPRDAVSYGYMTTLSGVMEKEAGEDPFTVPDKLRQLWEKRDYGKYADPRKQDIPVAFIADLDITGGNSGSPVINGKGELIGLAFDGNWEAVVGDYLYQEKLNRSINVDVRYILFILDKFSGAHNILNELSVH